MAVATMGVIFHDSTRTLARSSGVSHDRIHRADTVLQYAPELAGAVLAGTGPLDAAYAEARQRKEEQASRAG